MKPYRRRYTAAGEEGNAATRTQQPNLASANDTANRSSGITEGFPPEAVREGYEAGNSPLKNEEQRRDASPESGERYGPSRNSSPFPASGYGENPFPTRAEVAEMIDDRLAGLRIYVLESDITEAQQAVKSVVERAQF